MTRRAPCRWSDHPAFSGSVVVRSRIGKQWSCANSHLVAIRLTTFPGRTADGIREKFVKSRRSWAELYAFDVDRAGDAPVFRQIYLQLRSAILSGMLRPGTKLPSTRELAVRLGVSRSAVVSAFEQLLAEGYASGKTGAGTYLA